MPCLFVQARRPWVAYFGWSSGKNKYIFLSR
jgi:hypothetical protein